MNQEEAFQADYPVPEPPKWGSIHIDSIPLNYIFPLINRNALYRLSWGAKNQKNEAWENSKNRFDELYQELKTDVEKTSLFKPRAMLGYFPVKSSDTDLTVFNPDDKTEIIANFSFPRMKNDDNRSLSDYFLPSNQDNFDLGIFQIVTIGMETSIKIDSLMRNDQYSQSYYLHGLSTQFTEALAQFTHNLIRQQTAMDQNRGKRYSWGYPGLPDTSQHEILFSIMPIKEKLGIELTDAWQFVPEQTTAAIIVHNKNAAYFHV